MTAPPRAAEEPHRSPCEEAAPSWPLRIRLQIPNELQAQITRVLPGLRSCQPQDFQVSSPPHRAGRGTLGFPT